MEHGVLAGYPVVDVKVTLYDGSYHTVDSSEIAFKIAAAMAFRGAMEQAQPVLLEPIMNVEVTVEQLYGRCWEISTAAAAAFWVWFRGGKPDC